MIGTTSGFESHEEIMFPSITVCLRRRGDEYLNKTNYTLFHRPVNLKKNIVSVVVYEKNDTGHIQMRNFRPHVADMENRHQLIIDLSMLLCFLIHSNCDLSTIKNVQIAYIILK